MVTYYVASIIQVVAHRLFGHTRRIDAVFESHALGHHGAYAPDKLLLERWIPAEKHVMWYFAPLFAPMCIPVLALASVEVATAHCLGLAFAIWWHVFLHKQYHLCNSPFERFHWFRRKRDLHFVHHRDVHKNYAIVEFWLDSLFGTELRPNPSTQSRPAQAPSAGF